MKTVNSLKTQSRSKVKGWTLVYTDNHGPRIALIQHRLEAEEIGVIVLNKQDSSYLFGSQELYVKNEDVVRALHLINASTDE
jgi:hypothetical protein